ncbi:restriction endonuclease subunit S [Streptococcus suis]|nr:restriction endonuclease subunit S [Streptococcus suis]MBY5038560.1 restriction endonuclease subunit S [Streptococcus suis]
MKRGPFGSSITKSMFVPRGKNTYKVYEQGNAIRKTTEYGDYWLSEQDYLALKNFSVKPKDIIVSCAGTIGEIFQIPEDAPEGVINQALLKLTLNADIINFDYFKIMFASLVNLLKENSVGSAIKNLASIKFLKYDVPILLPPLAEQKRIVTKIERALEKVEAYAESYNKLQELDKSFPDKLKKSILQYAMQGKLVPQDPNDEPVEVLLEKIQTEKQKLYEEGKLKKKDLAEIVVTKGNDNSPYKEVPYNIPKSWEWVRLGNISSLNFFSSISGDKIPNDSWVLDMEDIEKETGRLVRKNYKTGKSSYKSNKISFSKDTILYAKLRPNLKKVIISDENGFATTELLPIKVFGNISLEYIRYCMISPFYYFNIIQSVYGVKMPRVSSGFLNSTLLPLPPLTEQQRIVSKISQVFSVIESLV